MIKKPLVPAKLYPYPSVAHHKKLALEELPPAFSSTNLKKDLQELPFDKFLSLLRLLPDHPKVESVADIFDEESIRRLEAKEIPVGRTVLIADIFVAAECFTASFLARVPKFLKAEWNSALWSTTDLLHMLYFMAASRIEYVPLLSHIEEALRPNLRQMTGNQLAFVCNAFYHAHYQLSQGVMDETLQIVLLDMQKELLSVEALNGILKSLTVTPHVSPDNFKILADLLMKDFYLYRLDPQIVMRIFSLWGSKKLSQSLLFEKLLSYKNPMEFKRFKDMERILNFCGQLGHPLPKEYADVLFNCSKSDNFRPIRHLQCVYSLVLCKIYHQGWLESVLDQRNWDKSEKSKFSFLVFCQTL
jgi:hypothetical protein